MLIDLFRRAFGGTSECHAQLNSAIGASRVACVRAHEVIGGGVDWNQQAEIVAKVQEDHPTEDVRLPFAIGDSPKAQEQAPGLDSAGRRKLPRTT